MRVAVAGAGSFAKYFVEELPRAGHEVVLLTRSYKEFFDGKPGLLEQRVTDYSSVDQLALLLRDCDALVSTVSDHSKAFAEIHLALIEACKRSPKCKRFIPSEFGGNSEQFPEEQGSNYEHNLEVKNALRAQHELEWTVISNGWLADYTVPAANRHHPDLGPLFPLDHDAKTFTIPGTGHEPFAMTSARDVAAAVAELLTSKTKWRPFTYIQGEETTWILVGEAVHASGLELKISHENVDQLKAVIERRDSPEAAFVAEFKLYVPLGGLKFDQDRVQRDRAEYFPSVRFHTLKEILQTAKNDPTKVV